jgi:hypothetical protein
MLMCPAPWTRSKRSRGRRLGVQTSSGAVASDSMRNGKRAPRDASALGETWRGEACAEASKAAGDTTECDVRKVGHKCRQYG